MTRDEKLQAIVEEMEARARPHPTTGQVAGPPRDAPSTKYALGKLAKRLRAALSQPEEEPATLCLVRKLSQIRCAYPAPSSCCIENGKDLRCIPCRARAALAEEAHQYLRAGNIRREALDDRVMFTAEHVNLAYRAAFEEAAKLADEGIQCDCPQATCDHDDAGHTIAARIRSLAEAKWGSGG